MWGALFAKTARRPLVAHAHRFDAALSRWWLPGYRYWIAPAAHRIVCVSDDIRASFEAAGVPAAKLTVVENAVSLEGLLSRSAARAELGLPADGQVIGMVARLRAEKRHDLAFESLALLRASGSQALLCIVGDGPEEARLRRLVGDALLEHRVRWAGPRENAGRFMRAFDVALICSEIEGMPLAALEAMVCGTPVVSTPVGALPSLLKDGAGTIVSEDAASIAHALAETLAAERGSVRERSAAQSRRRYGADRMAREVEEIYDQAVAAWEGRTVSSVSLSR
jgi:glycosyltransferase involved in cell wall biosynthesis